MVGSSGLLLASAALLCAISSEGADIYRQWVRPRVLGEDRRYAGDEHVARPHRHHREGAHYGNAHRFREVRSDSGPVGREAKGEFEGSAETPHHRADHRGAHDEEVSRSHGGSKFSFRQTSGTGVRKAEQTYQDSSNYPNTGSMISNSDIACVFCQYGLEQIVTNVLLAAQRGVPTLASLPGYMENHGQMAASIFPGPMPGAGNMPPFGVAGPWAPPAISFGGAPGVPSMGEVMSAGIFLETGSNMSESHHRGGARGRIANRTALAALCNLSRTI